MEIDYDPAKDAENFAKHGLSLSDYRGFESDPVVTIDNRLTYGEIRYRAVGRIAGKGHCLIFTIRDGVQRLISFRRAHEKEMRRYE